MKIYLIRHGETTGDVEDRYGGDYDDALTKNGQDQSKDRGQSFKAKGDIQALFASPKLRAQQSAGIIGELLNLPVVTINDFRERNGYGVLTGLTKAEALQKYPKEVEMVKDVHTTISGAEDYAVFGLRITDALNNTLLQNKESPLAVVTHGGPIRFIFREILGLGEIEIGDCAYALIEERGGKYSLLESDGITIVSS